MNDNELILKANGIGRHLSYNDETADAKHIIRELCHRLDARKTDLERVTSERDKLRAFALFTIEAAGNLCSLNSDQLLNFAEEKGLLKKCGELLGGRVLHHTALLTGTEGEG